MRAVGVEEAAAVGAELLDDFLRRDRPLRDGLLVTTVVCGLPAASGAVTVCGSMTATLSYGRRFWTTPCDTSTSAPTMQNGSSTQSEQRTRSTQKLPSVSFSFCAMPRMNAIASAMPVAAETKLWYASPAICVR